MPLKNSYYKKISPPGQQPVKLVLENSDYGILDFENICKNTHHLNRIY